MNVRSNINRIGNITSSNCWKLFATTAKVKTYLTELRYERQLGRSLSTDVEARPLSWGKLCEGIAFNLIGTEYTLNSQETICHPEIIGWTGTPDGQKKDCVHDIKCPYTLKSFCELVEIIEIGNPDLLKKEKPEYYWQLISNSILLNTTHAELIVYCPYFEDLGVIKHAAQNVHPDSLYKYYWLGSANDEELPYILKDGHYKDINKFMFEVPESDKLSLTEAVKTALEKL